MDIGIRRLAAQGVDPVRFSDPGEVVRWMGAMQGQDYTQSCLAIAARMHGQADVERAVRDRRILRTWPMRGTLHWVPAEDARWLVGLSEARQLAASRRRREQLELDEKTIGRAMEVFQEAREPISRPDLLERLRQAGIDPAGQRGYHLLYYAAQTGLLCLGPMAGKQQSFVRLDVWVPGGRVLEREEAILKLGAAYYRSHAPATVQDFAWWAGLTLEEARIVPIPEEQAWQAAGGRHLLPGFDEFLLGYQDRSAVLAPEDAPRIVPGGNGVFKPIVVEQGKVVGTWWKDEVELF